MSRVADDFAAIAQRLKEIQAEVAKEREAAEARRNTNGEAQPDSQTVHDDMSACA
jgi:septal ring factor EnvC (AmiA/AmiB activator)